MSSRVELSFCHGGNTRVSNPAQLPVAVCGKLELLHQLSFDQIKHRLEPQVSPALWKKERNWTLLIAIVHFSFSKPDSGFLHKLPRSDRNLTQLIAFFRVRTLDYPLSRRYTNLTLRRQTRRLFTCRARTSVHCHLRSRDIYRPLRPFTSIASFAFSLGEEPALNFLFMSILAF